jgi:uncharacterized protein YukE
MFLSNGEMQAAAAQVRQISAIMTSAINELGSPHSWSGADAERFQRDWDDLVTSRLTAAGNKLDGISFEDIKDAILG